MAITIDNIWFETQRRIALYKTGTVMPDSSLLGYDGDPNAVDKDNTDGELLLYYSSQGSLFQQSNGDMWRKNLTPNTWIPIGGGSGIEDDDGNITVSGSLSAMGNSYFVGLASFASGLSANGDITLNDDVTIGNSSDDILTLASVIDGDIQTTLDATYSIGSCSERYDELHTKSAYVDVLSAGQVITDQYFEMMHTVTRGALIIDTPATDKLDGYGTEREFLCMQNDNFVGDATYNLLDNSHALVLPYNTVIKRILLRAGATNGDYVAIGIHTNEGKIPADGYPYAFFAEDPIDSTTKYFSENNQTQIYTFSSSCTAAEGCTLGVSVSADTAIDATSVTVVLGYDTRVDTTPPVHPCATSSS